MCTHTYVRVQHALRTHIVRTSTTPVNGRRFSMRELILPPTMLPQTYVTEAVVVSYLCAQIPLLFSPFRSLGGAVPNHAIKYLNVLSPPVPLLQPFFLSFQCSYFLLSLPFLLPSSKSGKVSFFLFSPSFDNVFIFSL